MELALVREMRERKGVLTDGNPFREVNFVASLLPTK